MEDKREGEEREERGREGEEVMRKEERRESERNGE